MSETKTPTHFVVDRSRWRTGSIGENRTGDGVTELRNSLGYSCCLGFVCEQLGVTESLHVGTPSQLMFDTPYLCEGSRLTHLAQECICINDTSSTTPEQKEELLKEAFADAGLTIEFEGEYTRPDGGEQ